MHKELKDYSDEEICAEQERRRLLVRKVKLLEILNEAWGRVSCVDSQADKVVRSLCKELKEWNFLVDYVAP